MRDWTRSDKCASPLSIVVFGRCLAWEREEKNGGVGVGVWVLEPAIGPLPVFSATAGVRDARPGNKDVSEFCAC